MSRITFQKRQKEMKRQEKQQLKAEKRAARKMMKNAAPGTPTQLGEELPSSDVPQED